LLSHHNSQSPSFTTALFVSLWSLQNVSAWVCPLGISDRLTGQKLKDHFEAIESMAYSVSLFTDWQKQRINEVWLKCRMDQSPAFGAPPEFYGAKEATRNIHPVIELSAENCTEQMGVPGP
jgi:xylitol oxidase